MVVSLKQLLRQPKKTCLFFLLISSATLLVSISVALLYRSNIQMKAVESEYATIGMVEQVPISTEFRRGGNNCIDGYNNGYLVYDHLLTADILNFPGAEYSLAPKTRPTYISYQPSWFDLGNSANSQYEYFIFEIIPLDNDFGQGSVQVVVETVYLENRTAKQSVENTHTVQAGDIINFCQHYTENAVPLEMGAHYIVSVVRKYCTQHSEYEYVAYQGPYTTQCTLQGEPISDEVICFPSVRKDGDKYFYRWTYDSDIPDFSSTVPAIERMEQNENGAWMFSHAWVNYIQSLREVNQYFSITATDSLQLMPSFHSRRAYICEGRTITQEEFNEGEKVCLIPAAWTVNDGTSFPVGGIMTLPINLTLYGYPESKLSDSVFSHRYSQLNAQGDRYPTFFVGEYQIVGSYALRSDAKKTLVGRSDIPFNSIIVPANSISTNNQNIAYLAPMSIANTSFMIPNGCIDEFDLALHSAVPETKYLDITYDDNGYAEVMSSLENMRYIAGMLLFAGTLSSLSIIAMLIYYFVIKEQRRTAIERSLGCTKRQCRISLVAGLMVLTIAGAVCGSTCGSMAIRFVDLSKIEMKEENENQDMEHSSVPDYPYSYDYSLWKILQPEVIEIESSASVPYWIYGVVLIGQTVVVLVGALIGVNRNLKIEPIMLLGRKE